MLILDLLKPSTWLSSVEEGLMGSITNGLRTLCFNIDTIIYELIINLYEFFETLCEARLLDSSVLNELSKRIGLILGLVMFFYVVFSFIQMLINPDKITDKETGAGAIVKKVIIVIVMLGTSNFIFSELYIIQKEIINQNIISRIILPYQISEETMNNFGNELSAQLMSAFYWGDNFENRTDITIDDNNNITACQTMTDLFYKQIRKNGKFDLGYSCLNESINIKLNEVDDNNDDQIYIIYFNGIISVIAGVFVVYLLFMYCLKIGVRMVQLAVLEIISPMAIVSYLSPKKDTMFNKWGKIYFATYIDVFIRIAIINFVVFLILVIFSGMDNTMGGAFMFWESIDNPTGTTKMFFTVIIVLALLTFAKKAPELIKELFPSGASKLGFGASIKDIVGLEKGAKIGSGILGGALGGAAIGLLSRSPGGIIGGLMKGSLSGIKGQGFKKTAAGAWKSEKDSIKKMRDIRANGGGWFGSHIAGLQSSLGMRNAYEEDETAIANAQMTIDTYNDAESEAKSEAIKNRGNYGITSFDGHVRTLGELEKLATDPNVDPAEQARYSLEYDRLLKATTQLNLDYGAAVENGYVEFNNNGDFVRIMDNKTGNLYASTDLDEMSANDRKNKAGFGDTNAKIEVGMAKLGGVAHSGRGKKNKERRNQNSTFVTTVKQSKKYQKHKTNAGK